MARSHVLFSQLFIAESELEQLTQQALLLTTSNILNPHSYN
ncbi:hypothetical protein [uncultured Shewanella sp.]|nr:hypothetical protein [uncultured Shewanella sp.]